jgi:hypothetical protein
MKRKLIITIAAVFALQQIGAELSEKEMTARRAHGLIGTVGTVTNSDGTFMEFDANGNLVRQGFNGGKEILVYDFKDKNSFTNNNLPFKIVFEGGNVRKELLDNGEGVYTAWTFDDKGRVVNEREIGYPGHETVYRYRGDEMLPYSAVTTEEDESGRYVSTYAYTYTRKDLLDNWTECTVKVKHETYSWESNSNRPKVSTDNFTLSRAIDYTVVRPEKPSAEPLMLVDIIKNVKENAAAFSIFILAMLLIAYIVKLFKFGFLDFLNEWESSIFKKYNPNLRPVSKSVVSWLIGMATVFTIAAVVLLLEITSLTASPPVLMYILFGIGLITAGFIAFRQWRSFPGWGAKLGYAGYIIGATSVILLITAALPHLLIWLVILLMWLLFLAVAILIIWAVLKAMFSSESSGGSSRKVKIKNPDGTTFENATKDGRGVLGETYYKGDETGRQYIDP